jgi:hypothetical protein
VEFAFPTDFHKTRLFGRHTWWVRGEVKFQGAGGTGGAETELPIIINGIFLNTTWTKETLGGETGNVNTGEIKDLKSSIPFMDKASNPLAAAGGANKEAVEDSLVRGPLTLRHRGRAVTAEDYENIAKDASRAVAKAKCLPNTSNPNLTSYSPGSVTVVIVPLSTDKKPKLTLQLKEQVESALISNAPFMLVESESIQVIPPSYIEVSITATLAVTSMENIMPVENRGVKELDAFMHPLTGGMDGKGWALGALPCVSDFYRLLENSEGVDHVVNLQMEMTFPKPPGLKNQKKKYLLLPDSLPEFTLLPNALVCTGSHSITASYKKQQGA